MKPKQHWIGQGAGTDVRDMADVHAVNHVIENVDDLCGNCRERQFKKKWPDRRTAEISFTGWCCAWMRARIFIVGTMSGLYGQREPSFSFTVKYIIWFFAWLLGQIARPLFYPNVNHCNILSKWWQWTEFRNHSTLAIVYDSLCAVFQICDIYA